MSSGVVSGEAPTSAGIDAAQARIVALRRALSHGSSLDQTSVKYTRSAESGCAADDHDFAVSVVTLNLDSLEELRDELLAFAGRSN